MASDSYNRLFTEIPVLWPVHTVEWHLPNHLEVLCSHKTWSVKGMWVEMNPFGGKPWRVRGQLLPEQCYLNAKWTEAEQGPWLTQDGHVCWWLDYYYMNYLAVCSRSMLQPTLLHSPFQPCPSSVLPSLQSIISWPFPKKAFISLCLEMPPN